MGSGPGHSESSLPSSFLPKARLPVPTAASTAPTLATSPCTSPPRGSTMEFVVSEIPLGWGEEGWGEEETRPGLMVPLPLP